MGQIHHRCKYLTHRPTGQTHRWIRQRVTHRPMGDPLADPPMGLTHRPMGQIDRWRVTSILYVFTRTMVSRPVNNSKFVSCTKKRRTYFYLKGTGILNCIQFKYNIHVIATCVFIHAHPCNDNLELPLRIQQRAS